jgi:UDP-3-O-[3-hydroxymyristoyl] N-acetylglucosamine deacetylase
VPAHGFSASYVFHVPAFPGLRPGVAEFAAGKDDFSARLAGARTYYLRTEEQDLSGLLSKARAHYIVLDADSPQALVDEVARHKLVDFWGDLRLLGRPVWGSFTAFRTGHRFHHELIRKLVHEDYLETIELSESQVSYDHH